MLTVLCRHDVQRAITPSISMPSHGSMPLPNSELWKQRSMPPAVGAGHPYGSSPDSIGPSVCMQHRSCTICPAPLVNYPGGDARNAFNTDVNHGTLAGAQAGCRGCTGGGQQDGAGSDWQRRCTCWGRAACSPASKGAVTRRDFCLFIVLSKGSPIPVPLPIPISLCRCGTQLFPLGAGICGAAQRLQ